MEEAADFTDTLVQASLKLSCRRLYVPEALVDHSSVIVSHEIFRRESSGLLKVAQRFLQLSGMKQGEG
jgi:hypothetical protein